VSEITWQGRAVSGTDTMSPTFSWRAREITVSCFSLSSCALLSAGKVPIRPAERQVQRSGRLTSPHQSTTCSQGRVWGGRRQWKNIHLCTLAKSHRRKVAGAQSAGQTRPHRAAPHLGTKGAHQSQICWDLRLLCLSAQPLLALESPWPEYKNPGFFLLCPCSGRDVLRALRR
jgi:hypothetical protein